MAVPSPGRTETSWTWADKLSTYRFWGVMLFFTFSSAAVQCLSMTQQVLLFHATRDTRRYFEVLTAANATSLLPGLVLGFFAAWAVVRWRTAVLLIILAGLQFIATGVTALMPTTWGVGALLPGTLLASIAGTAMFMVMPAIIAGGRGTPGDFFLAMGVCVLVIRLLALVFNQAILALCVPYSHGILVLGILASVLIVLAVGFLLPVNRDFFTKAPPPRGYAFPPAHRGAVSVALLCFVPVYGWYWAFRWVYLVHGEVATLAPSRSLMSPRGAVGVAFIPLYSPVLNTTLADALNQRAVQRGEKRALRPWVVCLWSILFAPVAMGLIQSALNRAATAAAQPVPAPTVANV
jgi:hypothetical protein